MSSSTSAAAASSNSSNNNNHTPRRRRNKKEVEGKEKKSPAAAVTTPTTTTTTTTTDEEDDNSSGGSHVVVSEAEGDSSNNNNNNSNNNHNNTHGEGNNKAKRPSVSFDAAAVEDEQSHPDHASLKSPPITPPLSPVASLSGQDVWTDQELGDGSGSAVDSFLQFYVKLMSNSLHQDRGLKLLQYTLWLVGQLAPPVVSLMGANGVVPSSSSSSTSSSSASSSPLAKRITAICNKLSADVCMARYASRLFGWPAAVEAVRSGSWSSRSEKHPALFAALGKFLAWTMVGYYPLEHAAYLYWMAPADSIPHVAPAKRSAELFSAWSCRCWVAYIVTEMTTCLYQLRELQEQITDIENRHKHKTAAKLCPNKHVLIVLETSAEAEMAAQLQLANLQSQKQNVLILLARNALFFFPALHWSLPNWDRQPWLPSRLVNSCLWVEAVLSMYSSVKSVRGSMVAG